MAEVIKRVFSRPSTRKYPKESRTLPKGFRGRINWKRETCIFCMMCATNCPANAITVDKENKNWAIDIGKCIFCGRCHDVCPTKPKSVYNTDMFELSDYDREKFRLKFEK